MVGSPCITYTVWADFIENIAQGRIRGHIDLSPKTYTHL